MKRPEDCESIQDVRQSMDALDREVIGLIGRRASYVEAAARFKSSEQSVLAPNARERCSPGAGAGPRRPGSIPT